jgi:histidyl-tRNA synthetase
MKFQRLPGFRDFWPREMAIRRHVEASWHAAARGAGFEEVEGPALESLDLFKAKSGDAIVEELYAFTDKGGREVALRAELTPTIARMVAERAAALSKPIKWYAVPQLFRYERQQRGRLREHVQWNVDVFGATATAADAEVVAVALEGLKRLGLTQRDVYVRVFDRRVMERALTDLGVADAVAAFQLIDRGAIDDDEKAGKVLKAPQVKALRAWLAEPTRAEGELGEFLAACEDLGIRDWIEPDKRIVRGLAYYTGIVFEIFDRGRTLRAVAGGGRYDRLVEHLGGPSLPALGFGMGDVVLTALLEEKNLLPATPPRIDTLIVPIGEEMLGPARRVVRRLREAGGRAEAPFAPMRLNKALEAAEQAGARRVVLVGPDEWAQGMVVVKEGGAQRTVRLEELA